MEVNQCVNCKYHVYDSRADSRCYRMYQDCGIILVVTNDDMDNCDYYIEGE